MAQAEALPGGGNEPRVQQEPSRQHPVDQQRVSDFPLSKAGVTERCRQERDQAELEEEGLGGDNGRLKTRFWYSQGRARVIYKVEHRRGEGHGGWLPGLWPPTWLGQSHFYRNRAGSGLDGVG